jgi:tripartite motif-containing protein 71
MAGFRRIGMNLNMDRYNRLTTSGDQIRPAGLTRRAALGIAGVLGLSQHGLGDVAMSKKRRRRKKGRDKKGKGPAPVQARFVRTWGSFGIGLGQFNEPAGLSVAPNGDVYVADDINNRVQVFDAVGTFLDQWPIDTRPLDVEVAANRDVFATARDFEVDQIQHFSPGGTFLDSFAGVGDREGEFVNIFALAIGSNGDVYGVDRGADRIQQFSPSGTFIRAWGQTGSGDGDLSAPAALAAAPNGDIYVAEEFNFRVQRFSATGEFLGKWGSQGAGVGQFEDLSGITVAPDGTVFVADEALNRIQAFTSSGAFLGEFGTTGSGDGQFVEPRGLAVSRDRQLYVADRGNHRIQQFSVVQPAKKKRKKDGKKRKKKR